MWRAQEERAAREAAEAATAAASARAEADAAALRRTLADEVQVRPAHRVRVPRQDVQRCRFSLPVLNLRQMSSMCRCGPAHHLRKIGSLSRSWLYRMEL